MPSDLTFTSLSEGNVTDRDESPAALHVRSREQWPYSPSRCSSGSVWMARRVLSWTNTPHLVGRSTAEGPMILR